MSCGPAAPAPNQRDHARPAASSHHFEEVIAVHDAIIAGDLEAARAHAETLRAQLDPAALPPSWRKHVAPLWTAAKFAAATDSLPELARASAELSAGCGRCHRAHNVPLALARPPASRDPSAASLDLLALHGFALARLWDGIAIPSADSWAQGATTLSDAPLMRTGGGAPALEVTRLAGQVYALAADARAADDEPARVAVVGALLTTCAACHDASREPSKAASRSAPRP